MIFSKWRPSMQFYLLWITIRCQFNNLNSLLSVLGCSHFIVIEFPQSSNFERYRLTTTSPSTSTATLALGLIVASSLALNSTQLHQESLSISLQSELTPIHQRLHVTKPQRPKHTHPITTTTQLQILNKR
jgi:hypothetical protein